ncbi:MAG: ATP-grasp domain-containing protein [Steroidobacteraceae bacterium]
MKAQRILVLMHETLVPPDNLTGYSQQQIDEFRTEYDVVQQLRASGHVVRCLGLSDDLTELTGVIKQWRPHIAFNLAEEFQGIVSYDQHVVSFLELMRQPYTGCNPRGLLLSRDKALAKQLLAYNGIATPGFAVFAVGQRARLPEGLRFPLFVKSVSDDASFGISRASIVHTVAKLQERVAFVHEQTGSAALVEEFIAGRELYVGVIGNERLQTYPVWEMDFGSTRQGGVTIATRKAKWDRSYRSKHGIGSHPARDLASSLRERVQETARRVYKALSLTGYARIDLRLNEQGEVYVLEANANPCLTAHEDFARSAAVDGDDYAALLERIIRLGRNYRVAWRE